MSPSPSRAPAATAPSATEPALVVVVGSLNMDLVVRVPRVPGPGETLAGSGFATIPGGKGANQAVACARMGARVAMVGRLGADANGDQLRAGLQADGIADTEVRALASAPTGIASIWVEDDGQNRIVLAPGANGLLDAACIDRAGALLDAAALLIVQLEVPLPAVEAAVARAHRAGATVLLNPAPAMALPAALWRQVDLLVLNETEAALLWGHPVADPAAAAAAATALRARGPDRVIVTLGAHGVVRADSTGTRHAPARAVPAVDTTAAGDTFIGALAAALCEGAALDDAIALGQAAAALCVTRRGAQTSIPHRRELAAATAG